MSTDKSFTALPVTIDECHARISELALCVAERDAELLQHKAEIAQREAQIAQREEIIAQHKAEIAQRDALLAQLRKQVFGPRSERSKPAEATPQEIAEEEKPARERKQHGPRRPLPAYLHRETSVADLPDSDKICPCCGKPMKCIGEDASEQLDVVPPTFFVRRVERPRYACPSCKSTVRQAPLQTPTLPRAGATAGLAAHVMLWKYEDHLPLNRLERIFKRGGIDMERARMCDWMMTCSELLEPLVNLMQTRLLASGRLCADETPLQMQALRKTKRCWLWVTHGLDEAPYTVYRFSETRGSAGLLDTFKDYRGSLLTDAYTVYDKLVKEKADITLLGCWAHARRKFVEALGPKDTAAGDPRAQQAIDLIGQLYDIERDAAGLGYEERRALRQEKSLPQLARIKQWLYAHSDAVPKTPMGRAVSYTLDRWPCLERYVDDGRMPIDNNAVERAIRPVAVGRKNWLFAGSPRGGQAAANFFTLIESARRAGHNTFTYIADILRRIPAHPRNKLEELLPNNWKPPSP